ncbi:hypothetical protein ACFVGN_36890 [Streptomyces sp. NPDC057757]|uniref:hypothetical protein n=1 Tax=Streptomyces sp. NPDC057757 TaxID=3346241 RepID=UPI003679C327
MTAGWCSRTVRAAVFAAVCVLLAALGHVLMSGSPVPWWAMGAAVVATAGLGWCLSLRERGLPLITTVVVVTQGVLHSAFALAQSAGGVAAPGVPGTPGIGSNPVGTDAMGHDMGSMSMGSMGSMSSPGSMGSMGSMPMDSPHMNSPHMDHLDHLDHMDMGDLVASPVAHLSHDMSGMSSSGMLAAHLLAALLCGLWLGCGERAAFRILRALAGRLAAPLRLLRALPTPPHRPRVRAGRASSDRAPARLLLVHAITSRGPPTGTAVV